MKKPIALSSVVLLFIWLLPFVCTGEQEWASADNQLAQSDGIAARVFIAAQSSKFKDALLANITTSLDSQSVSYEVAEVSALKMIDEEDYNAVVIIQYVKAGRINSHVRRFLDRTQSMNKIVLVTTAGSGNPKTDAWDIDTITSASKMDELVEITEKVLSRLEALLKISLST